MAKRKTARRSRYSDWEESVYQRSERAYEKNAERKYSPVRDVINLTKVNVASGVGSMVVGSFPDVPQVPAFGKAKGFAMAAMGMMSVVEGSKVALNSLKSLEKIGKQTQRIKRRK